MCLYSFLSSTYLFVFDQKFECWCVLSALKLRINQVFICSSCSHFFFFVVHRFFPFILVCRYHESLSLAIEYFYFVNTVFRLFVDCFHSFFCVSLFLSFLSFFILAVFSSNFFFIIKKQNIFRIF